MCNCSVFSHERNLALLLDFLPNDSPNFQGGCRKSIFGCEAKGTISMTEKGYYSPNKNIGEINHLKRS